MIRRLARPMLATVFVIDGVETLRNPQAHVAKAAPLVDKATPLVEKGEQVVNEHVTTSVPPVTKDTETLVKALAGVKIGAGVLFAIGRVPRLSALALTASHLPTTVTRNDFWAESDPAAKSRKTTGLATDVALLGALLLASVDTAGQPNLAWRARKVGDKVSAKLPGAKTESVAAGAAIAGAAHTVADQARGAAGTVIDKAPVVAGTLREKAPEVAEQIRGQASGFADVVREQTPVVAALVRDRAAAAKEQAAPIAAQVREQAGAVAHVAADQAADTRKAALVRKKAAEKTVGKKAVVAKKKAARAEKLAGKKAVQTKKKTDDVRAKVADAIHP